MKFALNWHRIEENLFKSGHYITLSHSCHGHHLVIHKASERALRSYRDWRQIMLKVNWFALLGSCIFCLSINRNWKYAQCHQVFTRHQQRWLWAFRLIFGWRIFVFMFHKSKYLKWKKSLILCACMHHAEWQPIQIDEHTAFTIYLWIGNEIRKKKPVTAGNFNSKPLQLCVFVALQLQSQSYKANMACKWKHTHNVEAANPKRNQCQFKCAEKETKKSVLTCRCNKMLIRIGHALYSLTHTRRVPLPSLKPRNHIWSMLRNRKL